MEQGESKANVVKGNVLRLCVELTLRTLESVGANVESSEVAFVPKPGSVVARLADGARVVTMHVEGVEENRVTLADHGTLLPGEYSLEILCRDELDNPYRYMKRCAVEVHDATACAGIEAGVEFDAQVQYLGATFTQVIDGSGTPIDLGNYYTKDEIDTIVAKLAGINGNAEQAFAALSFTLFGNGVGDGPIIQIDGTVDHYVEKAALTFTDKYNYNGKLQYVFPEDDKTRYIATTDYVDDAISGLVNGAPAALDTLKELADALGDNDDAVAALTNQLANKVDKEFGKGLSTNDFTTALRNKLMGIEAGAQANVKADWNAESGDAQILNKPTIPTKTSELTNDSGFLTQHQDISGKADKSNTYTKKEVDGKMAVEIIEVTGENASATVASLLPNKFYLFTPALDALTITALGSGTGLCVYAGKFTAASANTSLNLPATVTVADSVPDIEANHVYEFNIADGVLLMVDVTAQSA